MISNVCSRMNNNHMQPCLSYTVMTYILLLRNVSCFWMSLLTVNTHLHNTKCSLGPFWHEPALHFRTTSGPILWLVCHSLTVFIVKFKRLETQTVISTTFKAQPKSTSINANSACKNGQCNGNGNSSKRYSRLNKKPMLLKWPIRFL